MARRVRLLIVDDHEIARAGARRLLSGASGVDIVGEADSGRAALRVCARLRPDIVLMDLHLGDMDGLTATREIRRRLPATRVIVFSLVEAPEYLREARNLGAEYVLKGATQRELLDAIQRARTAVLSEEFAVERQGRTMTSPLK
jgi:DNA-binding NarL/FixJ family response regulator